MTRCTNAAQICYELVVNALDVYRSDGHMLVFLGLVSPGQAPLIHQSACNVVEGVVMRGPQIAFLVARRNL